MSDRRRERSDVDFCRFSVAWQRRNEIKTKRLWQGRKSNDNSEPSKRGGFWLSHVFECSFFALKHQDTNDTVKPELTTTSEKRPPVYKDHHFEFPIIAFTT